MNNLYFLQQLFMGYCNCYSNHNWHKSSSFTDMTHNELQYFVKLGNMLGFVSRRETERMDISWHEFDGSKIGRQVLYLERENKSRRVLKDTLGKLLNPNLKDDVYRIGIFGWITPKDHKKALEYITQDIKKRKLLNDNDKNFDKRSLLTISFIGVDQFNTPDWKVEGNIWIGGKHFRKEAISEVDKGGYWYVYFPEDSKWEEIL